MLCQGEPESLKHNVVSLSLVTAFFSSLISLVNSVSFAAASESHNGQLISNVKITLLLFWETALGFPQKLQGLRFPIFRWVQLPHPSNLSCSVTPSHITLKSNSFHPVPRMYHSSFFFFFFSFFPFAFDTSMSGKL